MLPRERDDGAAGDKVVVAVKAEKEISKSGLAWALTHVVHPGDSVTLLAVLPNDSDKAGKRFWNFPRLSGDCKGRLERERGRSNKLLPDRGGADEISESCSQLVLQLHDRMEVGVKVKVVSGKTGGAVWDEARQNGVSWVILDKKLKQELRSCLDGLRCNIVLMKGSRAKVLRLNLGPSDQVQTPFFSASSSPDKEEEASQGHRLKHSTPASSPEVPCTSRSSNGGLYTCDAEISRLYASGHNPLYEESIKDNYTAKNDRNSSRQPTALESDREKLVTVSSDPLPSISNSHEGVFWIPENHTACKRPLGYQVNHNHKHKHRSPTSRTLFDKFVQLDRKLELKQNRHRDNAVCSNVRNTVTLGRTSSTPPPLCSLCQHKAPVFGKPPKKFSLEELEDATEGFSDQNFLAKGGFGVVYRGVLPDNQVVAIKLLKYDGSEADADFCREVRLLSCAQHRNVALLIGFCTDATKKILVYEYICNRSLDFHLHGDSRSPLDWHLKLKIAIGTARGLRYLHEDCRAGCIIHRDVRPNNILLTHDFEPLVADFGLARSQSEWNTITEDRLIGTSGYLAPEYINGGEITQAVDVYAFGVVLLELMTGRRISELQHYKGCRILSDWSHPLVALQPSDVLQDISELLDPSLNSEQLQEFSYQLRAMAQAASSCLCKDPELRPPMSKVLRILESGDIRSSLSLDIRSVGNRSGHLRGLSSPRQPETRIRHSRKLSQ